MVITTRFCPSENGSLHLGHVFSALVNECVAHSVGGKFIVRSDNTSYTSCKMGDKMGRIEHNQHETIEWLDIRVDEWTTQQDLWNETYKIITEARFSIPFENQHRYILPRSIRLGTDFIFYPYTPQQTLERVIMDYLQNITHIIRGEDFITEFSYYAYLCQIFDYPLPEFWYLPRLSAGGRDISKTNGGHTIAEYRANGYTPEDIKGLLAKSCLNNPPDGWQLWNIKSNPVLI